MLTPYQFAANSPMANIDLDGLEPWNVTGSNGEQGTVHGPYRDQAAAQDVYSDNETFGTYDLTTIAVSARRSNTTSETSTSSTGIGKNIRGGAFSSASNGMQRISYAVQAWKLGPLYSNNNPMDHALGAFKRYNFKEASRYNMVGGRAHLDDIDPNGLKLGSRFYRSNILVNLAGASGVIYGGYHAYQTGSTLLSLENSRDRATFIGLETGRNLAAIHQMHIASSSYSGVAVRLGLNTGPRWLNITGAFAYGSLRAAAGSTAFGLVGTSMVDYSRQLANPRTGQLYRQAQKKNPYKGFVIGAHDSFGFYQWLWGTNKN
jgi:hypothetical protein